jgi:hypothetical protein
MILNIKKGVFGDCIRNGDLIAVANVVEYLRLETPDLKFYIHPDAMAQAEYNRDFYSWMLKNTDYFSISPGEMDLKWSRINLWDFRDISGDLVKIHNPLIQQKKIVICPLFDAPYNAYRNWPRPVFEDLLDHYDKSLYDGYEKVILSPKSECFRTGWTHSIGFLNNLQHIMTAEIFIGGDTGTSHFAWALDKSPKTMIYLNSSRGLLHTLPFYLLQGKGTTKTYWLDFEGSNFQ